MHAVELADDLSVAQDQDLRHIPHPEFDTLFRQIVHVGFGDQDLVSDFFGDPSAPQKADDDWGPVIVRRETPKPSEKGE